MSASMISMSVLRISSRVTISHLPRRSVSIDKSCALLEQSAARGGHDDGDAPALFDKLLPDQALALIEPELVSDVAPRNPEVKGFERLIGDHELLGADVLELARVFLAGVGIEYGDRVIVEAGIGEFPEA